VGQVGGWRRARPRGMLACMLDPGCPPRPRGRATHRQNVWPQPGLNECAFLKSSLLREGGV
jgi:hypothetical protein